MPQDSPGIGRGHWRSLVLGVATVLAGACTATASPVPAGSQTPAPTSAIGTSGTTEQPTPSAPPGCEPLLPDLAALIDIGSAGPADPCFGDVDLTVDAYWIGAGVVDCPAKVEPTWLFCSPDATLQPPTYGVPRSKLARVPEVFAVIDPGSDIDSERFAGTDVRVTGHYDDAAAQTCRIISDPFHEVGSAIEACRRTFVVTGVEPLGA